MKPICGKAALAAMVPSKVTLPAAASAATWVVKAVGSGLPFSVAVAAPATLAVSVSGPTLWAPKLAPMSASDTVIVPETETT